MAGYIEKCECVISSLKDHIAGPYDEATIIKQIGGNVYLAEYKGVKCTAIFNPISCRYHVNDKYGKIREHGRPGGEAR